jgi:hypothetical protein
VSIGECTKKPHTTKNQNQKKNNKINRFMKKTNSPFQMKSPLNSYGDGGRGEVYLSDQPAFREMQGKIQAAADQVMSSWTDEDTETKLTNRIAKRGDREGSRNVRKKLISFGPDGKILRGDDRKDAIEKVTFDENEFLQDGTTANPSFGKVTGGSKKAIKFHKKTKELEDRKLVVTNKITADLKAYEADKLAFGNTKEGVAALNAKWPRPPRS